MGIPAAELTGTAVASAPSGEAGESGRVEVACSAPAVAGARRLLRADLARCPVSRTTVDDALLVASELLSNSIRYARPLPGGGLVLDWAARDGTVTVQVTDGGAGSVPKAHPASATATTGRGLSIVESLSRTWGVQAIGESTTVWAVVGPRQP